MQFIDPGLVKAFQHQIAGHKNEIVLRYKSNFILKPQGKPECFRREVQFYEEVFQGLAGVCPNLFADFHGVVYICEKSQMVPGIESDLLPYMMLEDITSTFTTPCVMDVKIGRQTFEPSASAEKIQKELLKYPHQGEIGFRISGFKVWDVSTEKFHVRKKDFGRSLLPSQIIYALSYFFYDGTKFRIRPVLAILKRLEEILSHIRKQNRYKFFSSSLLMVYDANLCEGCCCGDDNSVCRCVMIDFAHTIPSEEVDEDYVFGVENLMGHLRKILDNASNGEVFDFIAKMHEVVS